MDSFIKWIGGKKALRDKILSQFPAEKEYDRYIEVFGGAGWVLFAKGRHAKTEVFNDANGELINLYRCAKYHAGELQKELKYSLTSREQFFWAKGQNPECLTDIQKAARYFILIKESYGCDLRSFSTRRTDMPSAIEYLGEVAGRLAGVVIENRDFEKLVKTYDRETALLYLDPPYYGAEGYYAARFAEEDHVRLKKVLESVKGRFILSYNDCDYIRELYKGYNTTEVSRPHNMLLRSGAGLYRELIIKNFQ